MAVIQISRIQHRRGKSSELPDRLAEGEIGFATDTGELFIGTQGEGSLSTGAMSRVAGRNSYPYQNIKILTEFDVQYSITGDVYYHGPLKHLRMPGSGNVIVLFDIDPTAQAQFGNYDYSITSSAGCKSGQLQVAYHKVAGLSYQLPTPAATPNSPSLVITPAIQDNKVVLICTPSNLNVTVSLSGRQWSV